MTKTHLAAAALAAGFSAAAVAADDDSVTVNGITFYGSIDVGLTWQNHATPSNGYNALSTFYDMTGATSNNKSRLQLVNSGLGNSKFGFKGADDLGDGWTALFKLETGFNPLGGVLTDGERAISQQNGVALANRTTASDTTRDGQAFNQAAYVGVSNDRWGAVTFGRQTIFQADAIGTYDPTFNTYAFSPIGQSGTAPGGGDTEDTRWDESVKYMGSYGPFRLGAMYGFPDMVGKKDVGWSADLGADYAGLSVDAIATHKKDAVSASALSAAQVAVEPPGSLAATISDNTAYSLAARYALTQRIKLYAAYEYIRYANPSSPLPAGTTNIGGYDLSVVNNNAYAINRILQIVWGGARYAVSPKLDLAFGVYHYDQNSNRAVRCSSTVASTCSGQLWAFSVMGEYHLTKRFDLYGGVQYSQVLDGLDSGFLRNNTVDPTIGVRYSF
jgi:predicted porin